MLSRLLLRLGRGEPNVTGYSRQYTRRRLWTFIEFYIDRRTLGIPELRILEAYVMLRC